MVSPSFRTTRASSRSRGAMRARVPSRCRGAPTGDGVSRSGSATRTRSSISSPASRWAAAPRSACSRSGRGRYPCESACSCFVPTAGRASSTRRNSTAPSVPPAASRATRRPTSRASRSWAGTSGCSIARTAKRAERHAAWTFGSMPSSRGSTVWVGSPCSRRRFATTSAPSRASRSRSPTSRATKRRRSSSAARRTRLTRSTTARCSGACSVSWPKAPRAWRR